MTYAITSMAAREILDSRGIPTLAVEIAVSGGARGYACVPSGASTGKYEAHELRDGDPHRYFGKGMLKAIESVRKIYALLEGMDVREQSLIDEALCRLDGSANKKNLGANAILAVSLAVARTAATCLEMPLYQYLGGKKAHQLPVPMMNILNGGRHADNGLDIQEFMIMPAKASSFQEALRIGAEIFHKLKDLLTKNNLSISVGDEGGFAPQITNHRAALDILMDAIQKAGYDKKVFIALDAAASEFYREGHYHLEGKTMSGDALLSWYEDVVKAYPIISIEDAFDEDDDEAWRHITKKMGDKIQLVGDDLFVTNPLRIQKGIDTQMANAVLLKPNQIGTLSETMTAAAMTLNCGWGAVMSHRSGETEDTTIADLSVALGCGQIKTGSLSRSERLAKYNRLLVIEEELGRAARYAGLDALPIKIA